MPKSRPSQVIVHRIELQDTERELAEKIVTGKTIEAVGKGAVYVVGAGALAAGAYATWWTLDTVYDWSKKQEDYWDVVTADKQKSPIFWSLPAPLRVLWRVVD